MFQKIKLIGLYITSLLLLSFCLGSTCYSQSQGINQLEAPGLFIGNNAEGTLVDLPGGSLNAIRYQCTQDMTVTKMYAKIAISGSGKIKCAIYSDKNGVPDAFLRGTKELTKPGTGWKTFELTSSLTLTAGTWYHLVLWANNTGFGVNYTANGVGTPYGKSPYGEWPLLFGTTGSWPNGTYCLYADTSTVKSPNIAPTAVNDTYNCSNKASVSIDPLANDYDNNGDELHLVSSTNPLHGVVDTIQGSVNLKYIPDKEYTGRDSFTYVISDGITESSAKVIINVIEVDWSVELANMVINTRSTQMSWDYTVGLLLEGVLRVYKRTNDQRYLDFIKSWAAYHISSDGTITGMVDATSPNEFNSLDNMMPGFTILHLYQETGNERFKLAADRLRARFDTYPRNPDGCFWHMTHLNGELWLDGLYMGMPFLVTYGRMLNDENYAYSEAIRQFKLHINYLMDKQTGLLYHAYDYDGSASWALPPYNRSPYVWGRAVGWVMMGLADILDIIPENFPQRDSIVSQYTTVLKALAKYQDPTTGLWYQVIDHQNDPGNWLETSCSSMFVYAMAHAIQKGYLDASYSKNVELGYAGVLSRISEDQNKMVSLTGISTGTSVSADIQYYFNRAKDTNDNHGLGSFLIMNELAGYNNFPWQYAPTMVENIQPLDISIYPNPCNDYAELKTSILGRNRLIDVYYISGIKIKSIQNSGELGTVKIDMSDVPKGMYLIKVQSNGQVYTQKLIHQ